MACERRKVAIALKMKVVAVFVAVFVVAASMFASPTAEAAQSIDMDLACQYSGGYDSYRARVLYPRQGALGWRCIDRLRVHPTVGANLWGYCVNVMGYNGAYTNNRADPYSWYCA